MFHLQFIRGLSTFYLDNDKAKSWVEGFENQAVEC